MCVGSTSSAATAAFGLPVRKGSIRTRVSPSPSSSPPYSGGTPVQLELERKPPADGAPDEHPEPRLLRHQAADRRHPIGGGGGAPGPPGPPRPAGGRPTHPT